MCPFPQKPERIQMLNSLDKGFANTRRDFFKDSVTNLIWSGCFFYI